MAMSRSWISAVLLCAVALLVFFSVRTGGNPNREGPSRIDFREPADIRDLQAAVQKAEALVDAEAWDEAAVQTQTVRERWLSFKTPMRAGAGRRMWTTTHVGDFESGIAQLQRAVEARQKTEAKNRIDALQKILDVYDDYREGRPNAPRRAEGDDPSASPAVPSP